jgi:hypothetical protein
MRSSSERRHLRWLTRVRWLGAIASVAAQLGAQDTTSTRAPNTATRGVWQLGVVAGAARNSPNDGLLGTIPHRDLFMLGLQASTPLLRLGAVRVNYVAQVIPFFVIVDRAAPAYDPYLDANGIARLPERSYAFGISPFGIEVVSPLWRRASLFGATSGGGLIFTRKFPDVTGRRTNFTLEAGGGIRVRVGAAQWGQFGYKYHHISNAGTAFANPGLDGNIFYAGYQWAVRLPR